MPGEFQPNQNIAPKIASAREDASHPEKAYYTDTGLVLSERMAGDAKNGEFMSISYPDAGSRNKVQAGRIALSILEKKRVERDDPAKEVKRLARRGITNVANAEEVPRIIPGRKRRTEARRQIPTKSEQ